VEEMRPTEAAAVQPPAELPAAEIVELMSLRDAAGEPVRVLVSAIDELDLIDLLGALPAAVAPGAVSPEDGTLAGAWAAMANYAPGIIEKSCAPRFSFAEPTPDGCLPGAWLRKSERMALMVTALRVSGWSGAAATAASNFLARQSAARAGGEPALRAGGLGDLESVQAAAPALGDVQPAAADAAGEG
jgi:hypothetical protein